MKSLLSIIIFSILIISCGFKPIYSSKNSNFEIIEINNKTKSKNSFMIEKMIMSISNQEADKKLKIDLDYQKIITTILKDTKGDPAKNKLTINVNINVKDNNDNDLIKKVISEEFSYDVQDNKFDMSQYVNNISENLNNKISNDIIFLLTTLK
tara:strand:+ start:2400 stop:2858 length:459 start_codon:yes stop_codon:yes gene_type:complete